MLDTLTYPVSSDDGYRLRLKYSYQNGYLKSINDAANSSTVFWTLDAVNARGQITQDQLGNGIVRTRTFDAVTGWLASIQAGPSGNPTALQNSSYLYDLVGNVTQRQNNKLGLTEDFYYGGNGDNLYRLRESILTTSTGSTTTLALTYDELGNIRTKTDASGSVAPASGQDRQNLVGVEVERYAVQQSTVLKPQYFCERLLNRGGIAPGGEAQLARHEDCVTGTSRLETFDAQVTPHVSHLPE